jgi:hypothetical protein
VQTALRSARYTNTSRFPSLETVLLMIELACRTDLASNGT